SMTPYSPQESILGWAPFFSQRPSLRPGSRPAALRGSIRSLLSEPNDMNDIKFALRQLRKSPGFTLFAVLTLALGIGVNSAIFALINGLVLHSPIPLRPHEVVNVFTARQNASHDYRPFSHTEYRELRANGGDVFADVAALEFAVAGIGQNQDIRRSFAFLTSENFFSLMGVHPLIGRFYNADECRPDANAPVVVASYAFWKRMGGRQDFVGSNLHINGQSYTVIG